MFRKALIILNSTLPEPVRYRGALEAADVILCADGGANRAMAAGIRPHYIVGDLDSVADSVRSQLPRDAFVHRPSQDASDLEKTLDFALELGVRNATVLGVPGGRLDHQLCNLNILEKFSGRLKLLTVDSFGTGQFIRGNFSFEGPAGQQVSLIAFRRAEGITLEGLRYPLRNAPMEWGVNNGLSNEIVSSPVRIRIRKGTLFLYRVWPDLTPSGEETGTPIL